MATLNNTYQNLNFTFPDEGVVYKRTDAPLVLVNKGGTIYQMQESQYQGDLAKLPTYSWSGETEQALASIYGSVKWGQGTQDLFSSSATQTNPTYTQTISPNNPQGVQITGPGGEIIQQSPTILQTQANAAAAGGSMPPLTGTTDSAGQNNLTPITAPVGSAEYTQQLILRSQQLLQGTPYESQVGKPGAPVPLATPPLNLPGVSTQAPVNNGNPLLPVGGATGGAGATGTGTNPITSPGSLASNVAMDAYLKKLESDIANLGAGLPVGGQTKVLEDLFTKFNVQGQYDALNAYNQIVLDSKKTLKELPEAIRKSLQDVGVTQDQLTRLQAKETKPILDAVNEAMSQAGAVADRINQSLKLVGMFADASQADQAARFEIAKFQIQQGLGIYSQLKSEQKDALTLALTDQTNRINLAGIVSTNGAPKSVVDAILSSTDYGTASKLAAQYLGEKTLSNYASSLAAQTKGMDATTAAKTIYDFAKANGYDPVALYGAVQNAKETDKAPQVIGSADTGYLQYDTASGTWKPIAGTGGGTTTTGNAYTGSLQTAIDSGLSPEAAAQSVAAYQESIGIQIDQKTYAAMVAEARTLKPAPTPPAPPPPAPATAYQVGQNFGQATTPYYQAFNPENLIQGTANILSTTGDFFSGLFGF